MDEFFVSVQSTNLVKFFLQEILHGLDVMIGRTLDVLDTLGGCFIKMAVNIPQTTEQRFVERCQLRQGQLA